MCGVCGLGGVLCQWGTFSYEKVASVKVMYLVLLACQMDRVIEGDSGLCCCVPGYTCEINPALVMPVAS